MKKLLVISIVALCAASCSQTFTFVQMSDTQLGFWDTPPGTHVRTEKMLNHAVDEFNEMKPAFIIVTGDLCDCADSLEQLAAYKKAMARISPRIPVYEVPGNHDIQNGYSKEKYDKYMRQHGSDRFAFKYKGCSFIGFDSCCIKYEGSDAAEAEALQYAWLRQRLTEAKGSRHIFLFCHIPVIYGAFDQPEDYNNFPERNRMKYLKLFKEFNVEAVFCGHTHHPLYNEYNGTAYVICGSTGTTFEGSPSGYNVVTVDKDGFHYKFTAIGNQER